MNVEDLLRRLHIIEFTMDTPISHGHEGSGVRTGAGEFLGIGRRENSAMLRVPSRVGKIPNVLRRK
jgi:hypothetical protein